MAFSLLSGQIGTTYAMEFDETTEITNSQQPGNSAMAEEDFPDGTTDFSVTNESVEMQNESLPSNYVLTSAGFFHFLANNPKLSANARKDAQEAYEIVTNGYSKQSGANKTTDYSIYTHLGDKRDATDLENMKKAVDELGRLNDYRSRSVSVELPEGCAGGLGELKVSSTMMAIAQYNINASARIDKGQNVTHTKAFNVGENLAWSWDDPFEAWYDEELQTYTQELANNHAPSYIEKNFNVGHFLNIIKRKYVTFGSAYMTDLPQWNNKMHGQTFSAYDYAKYDDLSVTEYQKLFYEYYNSVKGSVSGSDSGDVNVGGTVYRLYNPNSGEHYFTMNGNERDHLVQLGWRNEACDWKASPAEGGVPVYCLYNPNAGDHHYTIGVKERDYLLTVGWKEGYIAFYTQDYSSIPVYRLYNPNAKKAGAHHYTTDQNERAALTKLGWIDEVIGWYGA